MDFEDFKNIAQGIQALGLFIAIICGGIWTVFKLISSKELDRARFEAQKLKKENSRKKGIEGLIKIDKGQRIENNLIPIFIEVELENKSSETHTLDWNKWPIKIARVEINNSNGYSHYELEPITKLGAIDIKPEGDNYYFSAHTSLSLLPESKKVMRFLWNCPTIGIYLISLSAPLPESLVKYIHTSDVDKKIGSLKKKYEDDLSTNYTHKFMFAISTYFQVTKEDIE